MKSEQFRSALRSMESGAWEDFEKLSSAFLTVEYMNLRTMASNSGDGGRDAELFCADGHSDVAFQYSIRHDWKEKIRETVDRILIKFPSIRILVYVTNQLIGALADSLKREALQKGMTLDVRDINWFVERCETDLSRQSASALIVRKYAIDRLSISNAFDIGEDSLSSEETKAALLYLGLQWENDNSDKGLTKMSFDALVRAALRDTDSSSRLKRQDIHKFVKEALPSHDPIILVECSLIK